MILAINEVTYSDTMPNKDVECYAGYNDDMQKVMVVKNLSGYDTNDAINAMKRRE